MRTTEREAWTHRSGVVILRTANNCFAVTAPGQREHRVLCVEVDFQGRLYSRDYFNAQAPYRDAPDVDLAECVIRVKDGAAVLAELGEPPHPHFEPWMVLQGAQTHVTENFVSVPPALHLTDERGDRWSLDVCGPTPDEARGQAPRGEHAFRVLRNAADAGEVASRIERRGGAVRIFTRAGWKKLSLSGREFL